MSEVKLTESELEILRKKAKDIVILENNSVNRDIECCVCLDTYCDGDNQIVICELCFAGVHQNCYQKELLKGVPEGDWFCERCSHLIRNRKKASCQLCSWTKGIIVQTLNMGWVHLACVNWIQEIWFNDDDLQFQIVGGQLGHLRERLLCKFCKV